MKYDRVLLFSLGRLSGDQRVFDFCEINSYSDRPKTAAGSRNRRRSGGIRADDRNAKAKPLSRRLPSLRRPCLMCRQIYTGPCPNTMTCGSPAPSVPARRTFRKTFKRRTVRAEVTPFITYIRAISLSKKEKQKKKTIREKNR